MFLKSADILSKILGFFTSLCNKKWQTQKLKLMLHQRYSCHILGTKIEIINQHLFFLISWHPAEIWEKKMQKLMLHWNFVKVICASWKTKCKTIIIYKISWHLAEKTDISSFYTEKYIQKCFCQIICSGRVAQWSTHWSSDLKVPGLRHLRANFFIFFL